jgi:hypothetical protein
MSRSYLDALGVAKQTENKGLTPFETFSQLLAQSFIERMRKYYTDNQVNASFQLAQSLDYNISTSAGSYNIEFSTDAEYFDVREQGISGVENKRQTPYSFKNIHPSKEFAQGIDKWMRAKGIPANDGNYQAASWAIATNVKKKGYEGAFMLDNVFTNQELQNIQDSLLTLTGEIIDVKIQAVVPETNIRE